MFQSKWLKQIFSLFADSCATSCNKKSMNQGQSIYSNNKEREICHFPTLCFAFFFFDENMPFFFSRRRTRAGGGETNMHANTVTLSLKKKTRNLEGGRKKMPEPPPPNTTWREGIWLWQTKYAL